NRSAINVCNKYHRPRSRRALRIPLLSAGNGEARRIRDAAVPPAKARGAKAHHLLRELWPTSYERRRADQLDRKDARRRTHHRLRFGYTLQSDIKPKETTSNAYRFEVALGGNATESFAVKEERIYDQAISVVNMTPDVLATWIQNRTLSAAGRTQLERIAAKK